MNPRSRNVNPKDHVSRISQVSDVAFLSTNPRAEETKHTPALIVLSICIFFLFTVILAQATFKLTFFEPDTSEETIIRRTGLGAYLLPVRRSRPLS